MIGWLRALPGRLRDVPIRRKLTVVMLASTAVALLVSGTALIGYAWAAARAAARADLESVSHIAADSTTAALAFRDAAAAGELLSALNAKPDIEMACLYAAEDGEPPILFAGHVPGRAQPCPAQPGAAGVREQLGRLEAIRAVQQGGDRIGWLLVVQNLAPLQRNLSVQITITLAILAASFLVSLSIAWAMQPALAGPILGLAAVARRVSESRDYSLRARKYGDDEVGHLVDDFNLMLEQIAHRDRELGHARDALAEQVADKSRANLELREALLRLQETQAQLVQSERLASLGGLVAGVAHEINTPVGVGVTAASTLEDRTREIEHMYQQQLLRRSDLERFVTVARESSQIILRNLQRAADLIHSFKQVAVDQSSGERRRFHVKGYIEEVLLSLAPKTKKSGHSVQVECPDDLELDSYPGAFAQILTNFVSNSLLHGYPDPALRGTIRIQVHRDGDHVVLRYSDDGAGIAEEHLKRIYDPFFTTKRGAGGSGLGLHIVYNLVHQLLGGTIDARSAPGRGTEFTVRFPAAPRSPSS